MKYIEAHERESLPHLHSFGLVADIERQQVETDGIRAKNEGIRSDNGINNRLAEAEVKEIEANMEETRNERIFFRRMIAIGATLSAISLAVAGLTGEPWFFTGGGIGVLLTGGGLRRLGVLTSPRRRKPAAEGRGKAHPASPASPS